MQFESWHWLVFGLVLATLEIFLPTFFVLWFGVAAVIVAGLMWVLPLGWFAQVVWWLVMSCVLCGLWFWLINPKIKTKTKAGLGAGVIIGDTGMIVRPPIATQAGVVRFATPKAGASEWACISDEVLGVGERVVIANIIGNELLVKKF